MNPIKLFLLLVSISFSISYASTDDEINHLLQFIESTSCTYERNGDMHNGQEAVKHIRRKYDYYVDDIQSTEDFIKYSATKSKLLGKHYKIHCAESPVVRSRDWLLEELNTYRESE